MLVDALLAFSVFAFVSSITPGPNNLMLLASGVNHGFKASIPLILGVSFGFFLMLVIMGSGLGIIFKHYPILNIIMKWLGIIYMLYLAWKIANSHSKLEAKAATKPISFIGAVAFQWINPKAIIMAASAFSIYFANIKDMSEVILVSLVFSATGIPCIFAWNLFGIKMRAYLENDNHRVIFNRIMAFLLIASMLPVLFH